MLRVTIYLDEIFIVNLLMDALVLWATGKLLQRPVTTYRLVMASLLGALYGTVIFLPNCIWLANGLFKAICALLMVFAAFGWINGMAFVKAVIYLYLVSFVFGGATIALMYFYGQRMIQAWSGIALMEIDFQLFWLAAGAVIICAMIHFLHQLLRKNLEQSLQIVSVKVQLRNQSIGLRLLVDSGNCLTDPINGLPVVVVQMESVRSLFTARELQQMEKGIVDAAISLPDLSERIRLLPFQAVGYRGLMLGVRLDQLQIVLPKAQPSVIVHKDVVMALSPQQFVADGSYQGILPPLLL